MAVIYAKPAIKARWLRGEAYAFVIADGFDVYAGAL